MMIYKLIAIVAVFFVSVSMAGLNALGPDGALESAKGEIENILSKLNADISNAEMKLKDVASMDVEGQNDILNEVFLGFKGRVIDSLKGVDLNSPLMDAMQRAKEQTIRLQNWYKRQPPDYKERDEVISTLTGALEKYTRSEDELVIQREMALTTLSNIGSVHAHALQKAKVDKVEESLGAIENLLGSLKQLNEGLTNIVANLEDPELPPSKIPND